MHALTRRVWPLIGAGGVTLLGGCALIYNFNDYTASASSSGAETGTSTASGGGSTSSAGSGGSGGCSPGMACIDAPPTGWTAVAFQQGPGPSLACPSGFKQQDHGGVDPQGTPPCAPCTCGASVCQSPIVQLYTTQPDCMASSVLFTLPLNVCFNNGSTTFSAMQFPVAAVCPPLGGMSNTIPMWSTESVTCVPTGAGSCSGGQCFAPPKAPFRGCISAPGDAKCPDQLSTKSVFYTAINPTSCTPCACSTPPCSGTTALYTTIGCQGSPYATLTPGVCANQLSGASKSMKTSFTAPPCLPSGGDPIGSVTEDKTHAVTVCCPDP